MSIVSNWPLPPSSKRYIVPKPIIKELSSNIVSRGLYPLAFGYYENANDHQIKRTVHNDNLLIFCVSGSGHFRSETLSCDVKENEMLIIPKGLAHEYQANSKAPWTIYWAHVDGHLFEQFHKQLNEKILLPITNQQIIELEFKQLMELHDQYFQLASYLLVANSLKKVMSLLPVLSNAGINQHLKTSFDIDKFKAYLEENITLNLTLDEMANTANLSKFHFAKKFQSIVGVAPIKYFLELKIRNACAQLDSSDLSVKNIAISLGFTDPYYFSRLFKKIMGMSPKQYRNTSH